MDLIKRDSEHTELTNQFSNNKRKLNRKNKKIENLRTNPKEQGIDYSLWFAHTLNLT